MCGLLLLAIAALGCVDLTPPWDRNPPLANAGGPDAAIGGYAGSASHSGSNLVDDPIDNIRASDAGASIKGINSKDAGSGTGGAVVPTGGAGGFSGIAGGSVAIVTSTNTVGGVTAASSVTGGVSSGGMVSVVDSAGTAGRLSTGSMSGVGLTGTTGGAPTGGSGGTPASNGQTGGASMPAGGSTSQTGGSKGFGGVTASSSSSRTCAGVVESSDTSICWYFGATGASCAQTCASHGGVSPKAAKQIGTAAQGGSASKCEKLFGLLGSTVSVFTVSVSAGLGCHHKSSMPLPYAWASSPAYNDNASESDVRIVCGCMF